MRRPPRYRDNEAAFQPSGGLSRRTGPAAADWGDGPVEGSGHRLRMPLVSSCLEALSVSLLAAYL
jgi:hypothetical protein